MNAVRWSYVDKVGCDPPTEAGSGFHLPHTIKTHREQPEKRKPNLNHSFVLYVLPGTKMVPIIKNTVLSFSEHLFSRHMRISCFKTHEEFANKLTNAKMIGAYLFISPGQ